MTSNIKAARLAPAAPPVPDLSALPANVDRRQAAEIITQFYFPVSPRSLERWPVTVRHVNGKAITPIAEYLAQAHDKFDAAPVLASGRQPTK